MRSTCPERAPRHFRTAMVSIFCCRCACMAVATPSAPTISAIRLMRLRKVVERSRDLLQVEDGAAAPQIVHSERMPESVDGPCWGHDAQPLAKPLHSAQFVAPSHVLPLPRWKHKVPLV